MVVVVCCCLQSDVDVFCRQSNFFLRGITTLCSSKMKVYVVCLLLWVLSSLAFAANIEYELFISNKVGAPDGFKR